VASRAWFSVGRATGDTAAGVADMPGRVPSVDALRGAAVLLMAMGNLGLGVAWVPGWLKHTPDAGYTVADLVAPVFIVVSAASVTRSMHRRRASQGTPAALGWLARRAVELIGIGAVVSAGQAALAPVPGVDLSWGVLQSVGGASLLLALVVLFAPWVRVVAAAAMLAGYEWLLAGAWGGTVLRTVQGGLPGTLAWGALMILASAVSEAAWAVPGRSRARVLLAAGAAALVVGSALAPIVPVSKNRVSASYVLVSLGLGLVVWAVLDLWLVRRPAATGWLRRVGRYPLVLYFAHLLLLAPLTLAADPWWYSAAPPWLTLLEALVMASALVGLAGVLDRSGWRLRL